MGVRGFWVVLGELIGVGGVAPARRAIQTPLRPIRLHHHARLSRVTPRDTGHWLRLIAAGALVVFVPIYAGSQVFATGKAFNAFLDWNYFLGRHDRIPCGALLHHQRRLRRGRLVRRLPWLAHAHRAGAAPIAGLLEAGGVTNILDTLRANDPSHLITAGQGWTPLTIATIVGFAAIGIGFLGSPQVFVRFICCGARKRSARVPRSLTWTLLADSGAVLVGVVEASLYTMSEIGGDKDNILPFMSQTLLPAFLAGIYIAMVLSAIMSTIDSLLVVASSCRGA